MLRTAPVWSRRVALARVADPDDIAHVVLFVASPDAAYVTGSVIPVDGGTSASNGTPRPR
ncbi:SDR family oxidoreductase [Agromyces laixinhei]|uniref:SDR family oxidoreductase n=1 Tax=Agromyces laixinhei TaxID=2585717 RepID=UPI0011165CB7|nr:SDR family oxidoreductase [Agromyces laixinhei]